MNDWGLKGNNKTQARQGPGGGGRTSQLGSSRAHLYYPPRRRADLPWLALGEGWGGASSGPGSAQPSPSLSSASTGLGPWGECAGARMEPKNSERNWRENRGSWVSSEAAPSLCLPPQPLPPCLVVSDFATPWTVAHQAPLSLGLSRQEYWSGLPCPPPGDLPHLGTEPRSPAWLADSFRWSHQ